MGSNIPLFEISYDETEIENALESITRGGYWAKGPFVTDFEERLAEFLGVDHAVTVNSGTSALLAALVAHDIGPGDEVVVPSFTFIATANAVRLAGARPVFADIERETYGLDPASVRERIGPDTEALLPVHPYGGACKIHELADVASEHGLVVIEDAAEAFGATAGDEMLGTVGDSAALSFCQNKVITTGEGGAVLTDDPDVARKARLFRSHGRASEAYFDSAETGEYVTVGTNVRMADVNAAIGCAQLSKAEELISQRRSVATSYHDRLAEVPSVEPHRTEHGRHVYQLYTVTLDDGVDRNRIIEQLAAENVDSKIYWDPPTHRTECYRHRRQDAADPLPVTDDVSSRVLSLPMHPELADEAIDRVVDVIRRATSSMSRNRA
jgi:perosamine synthetase